MLDKFNVAWPRMKPLVEPIYGKLILFAGAETQTMQDALYRVGIRNILVSYHYLRKQTDEKIREKLSKFNFVMLDSGAFTFIQRMNNGEDVSPDEIRQFTHDYIAFCDRMSDCFNWVVEMDVADRVSEEFYLAQQEEFLSRGIRVLPVIHGKTLTWYQERGWFDKFDAVAIAGRLTGGAKGSLIPYLNEARKKGVLVHGLAATDTSSIERMPYFSCDSTTWLSGGKFGSTYIFRNGTLVTYDNTQKDIREKYKKTFIDAGIDWDLVKKEKSAEVNAMNAVSWFNWQEWIKYDTRQSYWLTDAQIAEGKELMAKSRGWKLEKKPTDEVKDLARSGRAEFTDLIQIGRENGVAMVDPRAVQTAECNNCSLAFRCEHFEPDQKCVYKTHFAVGEVNDTFPLMGALISMQFDRINQERLNEIYDGNRTSKELTNEIKTFFKISEQFNNIRKEGKPTSNLIRSAMQPSQPEIPGEPPRPMRTITASIISEVVEDDETEEDIFD